VVEDDELAREALAPLLAGAGYEVGFAENGCEALAQLRARPVPDIILFDLAMPAMDGWEFRAIQKNDPVLREVPAVAITADGSPQAMAISAEAYLRKPFGATVLLDTIERILAEKRRHAATAAERADGLTSLARLASAVGHEINNPLTIVLLNLAQAIRSLGPSIFALETRLKAPLTDLAVDTIRASLIDVAQMLEDGKAGAERIGATVAKLAHLNRHAPVFTATLDLHALIDGAIRRVWDRLRDGTRLIKCFATSPVIRGDRVALEQVFVDLLLNAAKAIPADSTGRNEIRIVTRVGAGPTGPEAVVEIHDSGIGLSAQAMARLFEPFFSTKPTGSGGGTGLGLTTARQSILKHGGRLTIDAQPTRGAVARVFLPITPAGDAVHAAVRDSGKLAGREH